MGSRQLLLIVALVGILALAGCADTGTGDDPSEELPDEPDDEALEEDTDTDTEEGTDDETDTGESNDETDDGEPADPDGELEIHHIDVGQADSTLVRTPNGETILIDTGGWQQDGSDVIAYLDEHGIDRIDHLIATHGHADHIGGHAAIIEEFETNRDGVGAVYDSGVTHTSQTYENYLDTVDEHDVELFAVEAGDELPIESESLSGLVVNPPEGDSGDDLHDNSVAVVFEFGDVRYLTTGDAETETEARLLEAWHDELDVDIYQAGHHGSSTSSSSAFMEAITPEIAIISSAYDSQYGHPHDETLEAFADSGIETYWTGVHGDIVVTTDGSEIDVTTAESFSNDAADLLDEKPAEEASESVRGPPPSPPSIAAPLSTGPPTPSATPEVAR
jgi:competence protein ComEC